MKCKIELTNAAWEDLKSIQEWYVLNFGKETALKVTLKIKNALNRLEDFPDSGSRVPDEWLDRQGYRMVITGRHAAVYKHVGNIVFVYRIVDTRRQYTLLFYE